MYKHILLPTDGTKLSEKAIKQGVALAQALKARVTAIAVSPASSPTAAEMIAGGHSPDAAQHLAKVRQAAASSDVSFNEIHVENDEPYKAIVAAAKKQGCDLIVMASHGRSGISALVLGSVTAKVLTHTTVPVLVCR